MAMRANTRSVSEGSPAVEADAGVRAGDADRAGHVLARIGRGFVLALLWLNIEPSGPDTAQPLTPSASASTAASRRLATAVPL